MSGVITSIWVGVCVESKLCHVLLWCGRCCQTCGHHRGGDYILTKWVGWDGASGWSVMLPAQQSHHFAARRAPYLPDSWMDAESLNRQQNQQQGSHQTQLYKHMKIQPKQWRSRDWWSHKSLNDLAKWADWGNLYDRDSQPSAQDLRSNSKKKMSDPSACWPKLGSNHERWQVHSGNSPQRSISRSRLSKSRCPDQKLHHLCNLHSNLSGLSRHGHSPEQQQAFRKQGSKFEDGHQHKQCSYPSETSQAGAGRKHSLLHFSPDSRQSGERGTLMEHTLLLQNRQR